MQAWCGLHGILTTERRLIDDIYKRLAASSGRPIALLDYIESDIFADMADIRLRMGGVDPNSNPSMTALLLFQQTLDKVRVLYRNIIAKLAEQKAASPTALLIPDTPLRRSPAVNSEGDTRSSDAPTDLIEAYQSSMGRSDVSQADRQVEAPNLPAAAKPDPEPQATPQLKATPGTNEAPPLDEAPAQPGKVRKRRKEPEPWEQEAYKLCERGGFTQKKIAEMLSSEFHIPLDQSQISKAKDRVRAWKGEPKPDRAPKENRPRKHNVDPQKLQHVAEAGGPTLAEQMERGPAPLGNRMRTRNRGKD